MTQKLMSEPGALCRTFDETGNVSDDKTAALIDSNDSQVRVQGSERIVCDSGPCCRNRADERGFSGVRHTEQAHIGEHLELESELAADAWITARELPWGAVHAR